MTRRDKLIKIVLAGNKGGSGKTTVSALLAEYLNFLKQKVQLIDVDPNQVLNEWINNCQSQGRAVSQFPATYQIIDTAGSSGSALTYIKQAEIILVPFVPHYVDLQVIIPWFDSLSKEQQNKVHFLPNRFQNTKEQREGLSQLVEVIKETRRDKKENYLLPPLKHRPALYGSLLNGSKENFFTKSEAKDAEKVFQQLLKNYAQNKKVNH